MNMKKVYTENDFVRVSDLALAVVIVSHYPIEAIERNDPRRVVFLFKRDPQLDELVENYWRGEVSVEPRRFFNELRDLKARLYSDG